MSTLRLNEILNRLNGVKSVGREHYLALCPCHDDHRPSLDIAVKNNKTLQIPLTEMSLPGVTAIKTLTTMNSFIYAGKKSTPDQPATKPASRTVLRGMVSQLSTKTRLVRNLLRCTLITSST